MKRHGIGTLMRSAPLDIAIAFGAFGLLFGRGVFRLAIMLVGAAIATAWWAFTSEP